MSIILGKPQVRGKSDVLFNYDVSADIAAGTAVKRTGETSVAQFDGAGIPFGIAGYVDLKGQKTIAVCEAGKSIGVLLDNPNETITAGSQVFLTENGKATQISTDNTPTGAIFVSAKSDGINVLTDQVEGQAALIDMIGGL
ncbi:MAG: hypothetical protein LBC07_00065 [Elusimicrobiota bacterium]|jgi:hypothetical protein|nr:hypothetical protein [Elusimicrobiota bacterium]